MSIRVSTFRKNERQIDYKSKDPVVKFIYQCTEDQLTKVTVLREIKNIVG